MKEKTIQLVMRALEYVFVAKKNVRVLSEPTVTTDGTVTTSNEELTYQCVLCIVGRAVLAGLVIGAGATYGLMKYL
jgi:hypothetical protein